jgi:pyruvate dehydrogenase E2 component (dihydrolipoamide acetyltransferase)
MRSSSRRAMSSYPAHQLVGMPSLSPTMTTGTIAKWNKKEGEKFLAGDAICEVETDKATVTYEATDDGVIARILAGTGEIKVGDPLMIVVEDASSVAAFAGYTVGAAAAAPAPKAAPAPAAASAAPAPVAAAVAVASAPAASESGARVVASPYAKTIAKQAGVELASVVGSGPNGRIIAADVQAQAGKAKTASAPVQTTAPAVPAAAPVTRAGPVASSGVAGASDFHPSPIGSALGSLFDTAKKTVPHFHLSVEINLSKAQRLLDTFNADNVKAAGKDKDNAIVLTVQDLVVKAAALSMKKIPVANGAWMDTFVRCYDRVDINLFTGSGANIDAPLLVDAGSKGLLAIASETKKLAGAKTGALTTGTFSIHNLSSFGVKSAAAIVLPPQSCALALGAVRNTVVPKTKVGDEPNWEVRRHFLL